MLYHENTLSQIVAIRSRIIGEPLTNLSPQMAMVAGSLAGIMHGSQRRDSSSQYLSISMPNTFSMSPSYVRRYIADNQLRTIDQNVFERLRDKVSRQYLDDLPGPTGYAFHLDATEFLHGEYVLENSVDLVVTSPPYLQVVNYAAANWIRLWLMGVDEVSRDGGSGRLSLDARLDHNHEYSEYKEFISGILRGIRRVLKADGVAAVVIGDVANPGKAPVPLAAKIWEEVGSNSGLKLLQIIEDDLPSQAKVSRIWGETKGQATNRDCVLVLGRDDHDARPPVRNIEWAEPYKDAGPDAAHARVRMIRRP